MICQAVAFDLTPPDPVLKMPRASDTSNVEESKDKKVPRKYPIYFDHVISLMSYRDQRS